MEKMIYVHSWLTLPSSDRLLMRQVFNIPRTSGTVSIDGKLSSDGHTEADLRAINTESMQKFLDDTTVEDFSDLYIKTIAKIHEMVIENERLAKEAADAEYEADRRTSVMRTVNSLLTQIRQLNTDTQREVMFELNNSLSQFSQPVAAPVEPEIKTNAKAKKAK